MQVFEASYTPRIKVWCHWTKDTCCLGVVASSKGVMENVYLYQALQKHFLIKFFKWAWCGDSKCTHFTEAEALTMPELFGTTKEQHWHSAVMLFAQGPLLTLILHLLGSSDQTSDSSIQNIHPCTSTGQLNSAREPVTMVRQRSRVRSNLPSTVLENSLMANPLYHCCQIK